LEKLTVWLLGRGGEKRSKGTHNTAELASQRLIYRSRDGPKKHSLFSYEGSNTYACEVRKQICTNKRSKFDTGRGGEKRALFYMTLAPGIAERGKKAKKGTSHWPFRPKGRDSFVRYLVTHEKSPRVTGTRERENEGMKASSRLQEQLDKGFLPLGPITNEKLCGRA